jgi:DNA polymerase III delta subunit
MITILHGDNIVASRKELDRIKTEFVGEVITLDGKTASETDYIQATQSASLFGDKKLVIVEGLPKFDLVQAAVDVVVWEGKSVNVNVPGATIKEFKIPPTIWKFIDRLTVPLFRQALKDNDVQFIFLMIVRKYRLEKNAAKLKQLLELDYQYKQGLLAADFATAIELFLLGV